MWAQNYSGRPGSCANSAKLVLNLEKLFEHVNGQTQLEPESCVKHRVWKAMRDGECECACTSQCVRGKTDEKHLKKKEKRKRENQTSTDGQEKVMDLITRECPRHRTSHPPCGVTLFCCTVCRSWRRCWTRAAESAAGTGPVGTASGGWSRGSGWLWLNRCAEYSQWDRKLRKM